MSRSVEDSGTPPQQHDFDILRFSHDNLASESLEKLLRSSASSNDLYPRIAERKESDSALKEFWDQSTNVPPWVDWAQVRRGQLVFNRYILPIALGFAFQGRWGDCSCCRTSRSSRPRRGTVQETHPSTNHTDPTMVDGSNRITSVYPARWKRAFLYD